MVSSGSHSNTAVAFGNAYARHLGDVDWNWLAAGRGFQVWLLLVLLRLPGTLGLAVLVPKYIFSRFPFGLTFAGQYIVKNLVLASAHLVLGARVRSNGDSV